MTRDEIVSSVLNRLGRTGDTAMQTIVETELATIQSQILEGHAWLPWFLLTENATETTLTDEERVEIPTDFLAEEDDQALWRYDADATDNQWVPLKKDDLDVLRDKYPGTGLPVAYALRNKYFVLKPTPDDEYTLKMSYYARDAELTAGDSENKWTIHAADLVIAETCIVVAEEIIKDYDSAERFKIAAKRAWDRLYRKHVARAEAGGMRQMGED